MLKLTSFKTEETSGADISKVFLRHKLVSVMTYPSDIHLYLIKGRLHKPNHFGTQVIKILLSRGQF